MKYWDEKHECMDRKELERLQLFRLQKTVAAAYQSVGPFRQKMRDKGVLPGDVKTLEDIRLLPFMSKQDLRDYYPFALFGKPLSEIARIHASSGTTGKPIVIGYTKNDLDIWSEVVARCLTMVGADKNDIIQISYGYGLFTGGLGLHDGAGKIGAAVIPASSGNSQRQIMLMKDLGATVLCCTPSYALYLSELLAEFGVKKEDLKLKYAVLGAEAWTSGMAREIEQRLGVSAHNIYGLTEVIGPGVAIECQAGQGMHISEDHFLVEVIDPETEEVLPDGMTGELVFTCLTKEGTPTIRYRTRDLSKITKEKCSCGRTLARMDRIMGRSDDMLTIRGVNVYPSQIESVLLDMGQTSPNYHLVVDRVNNLDILEVQMEIPGDLALDGIRQLEALAVGIRRKIEQTLGISCKVTLVEPRSLPRSEGKAKRVTDRRKM
ncbi:MAG: phenylacetate--CoA ligase [Clostridiales bacterium]|nr:phenylacetate--CoA ligase [Clostridiales bacterium]